MAEFILKALAGGMLLAASSMLARQSAFWAALAVSLPLTSLIALCFAKAGGTPDPELARIAIEIAKLTVPSLSFFIAFAWLLRSGASFYWALPASMLACAAFYAGWSYFFG